MARVFISYARVDGAALAERLEADLRERQHAPWLDRATIRGGDDWSLEIEQAIDDCDGLVALLTKGSYSSRVCRSEIRRALRKEKYLVPLLVQKGADIPLDLEVSHYLDFTDAATYESSLGALLQRIVQGNGVRFGDLSERSREQLSGDVSVHSMEAALVRRQASWDEVTAMAELQRSRFLESLAPRPGGTALYEPALYVPRAAPERELDEFLAGDARGLVLLGDMGIGKTNLLCHWSAAQVEKRHAVLMFTGDRLTAPDIESELATDLTLADPAALWPSLGFVDELAGRAGRRLIVVIDALNDFRGTEGQGQLQLLLCIDRLVSRLPGKNVRVVVSCSTPAWERLQSDRRRPAMTGERYHGRGGPLELQPFTAEEAATAFERYRAHFKLPFALPGLPPALAVRLRIPLLLRLLADTYAPSADGRALPPPDTLVFSRYYEQRLQRPEDKRFVLALALEMYAREDAALPVASLYDHPVIGPALSTAQPEGSYARLLDDGVLLELKGDDPYTQDLLRFSYPLVGSFALATALAQSTEPREGTLRALVQKAGRFALAWDAAVTLLVMAGLSDKRAAELYAQLGGAPEAAVRELTADGLVRLSEIRPERAAQILDVLLNRGSRQQQRSALRAAFRIGPLARELILRAAVSSSQALRRAVRDSLYVIWIGSGAQPGHAAAMLYSVWRQAPKFTHELMKDLVARMSWRRPRELWRTLWFVLDWCITMYINHCDSEEVAAQTSELFHDLAVNGLGLERVNLGRHVEGLVATGVAAVFARPILDWMLESTPDEAAAFFRIPAEERSVLARIARLLDPESDLLAEEALICGALRSGVYVYSGAAALAVAVHAYRDFPRYEPRLRAMYEALDSGGRIWLLMSFAVLLRRTPSAWTELVEEMTRRCIEEGFREGDAARAPKVANLLLVPLGLAYGKQGKGMPLFEELAAAAAKGRRKRDAELLALLAPVGFYHPQSVLDTLRPHLAPLAAQGSRAALALVLATMRTLHHERVDLFMEEEALDEALRQEVTAATDVALIDAFMRKLGLFNNAVHQCLFRPGMRKGLSEFPLEVLATAGSSREFIVAYATQAIRMARQTRFQLLEWFSCTGS